MVARLEQPGPGTTGLPPGGTTNQVLAKTSPADYDADWVNQTGGGAPTTADYLVGTANGSLTAEIVVGTSPGGELGGTWASPTVDATHSGSSHASVQAAAEATAANASNLTSGTVADARIASTIARDSEVTTAVAGEATARDAAIVTERSTAATLTNKTLTAPVVNSPTGIVKADVGLGNVDNTADASKAFAGTQITSGTVPLARLPTGTNSSSVPVGGVITAGGPTGDASHTLALTYNAAGQLTTVTNNAIAIAESQVTNLTTDLGNKASSTLAVGGDLTGNLPNPTLAAAGPGATGPIGDATHSAAVTIDAKGRVTALSSVAITGAADKLGLTPTAVKTAATYTAAVGDFVPCDTTSNAITITLPTAPADGSVIAVKLVIQGGTNVVTITCGGSDVFNKAGGSTSGTITLLNEAYFFQYKSSSAIWYLVLTDTPATTALLDKITGVTTTAFALGMLDDANGAAVRTTIGAGPPLASDTLWDTKGDGVFATGADAAAKVPAGTDGKVLNADSSQTAGVAYITMPAPVLHLPTGALAATFDRNVVVTAGQSVLTSGQLYLCTITLMAGQVITSISFKSASTAMNTGTHQIFGLFNISRLNLRYSSDDTNTAWGSTTVKTLNLASTYTVPTTGDYYLGCMVAATTPPNLVCSSGGANSANVPPISAGVTTDTGLTTVASMPSTAGTITSGTSNAWGWVS